MFVKYGKLAPEFHGTAVFKRPQVMLEAGSCFHTGGPPRPYYGGAIGPDRLFPPEDRRSLAALDVHPVQAAFGLAVPTRWLPTQRERPGATTPSSDAETTMKDTVLLCTVGGSHQPILRAIEAAEPRYVCFFCTGKDPDSGKPGSEAQVIGKGKVIKASHDDDKPTLPNIPAQAGLADDVFEPVVVRADDHDGAWRVMRDAMDRLAGQFRGARLVADYTGGTKTMTAALVCAALERSDVELQLVTSARANLVRVPDGTERAMPAGTARLRLAREMAPCLNAWRRFAYRVFNNESGLAEDAAVGGATLPAIAGQAGIGGRFEEATGATAAEVRGGERILITVRRSSRRLADRTPPFSRRAHHAHRSHPRQETACEAGIRRSASPIWLLRS